MNIHAIRFRDGDLEAFAGCLSDHVNSSSSSAYYFCNAHMFVDAHSNEVLRNALLDAECVYPDGSSVYGLLRILGHKNIRRLRGPDAMKAALSIADERKLTVGFFGGSEATLLAIRARLDSEYPNVNVRFLKSPKFGSVEEIMCDAVLRNAEKHRVDILFVGLGCPKQEILVSQIKDSFDCPILAVGAAFDFFAGTKGEAPRFITRIGFEWLYRLVSEPKRLWRRYLFGNTKFLALASRYCYERFVHSSEVR